MYRGRAQLSVTDCLVFKKPGDLETILHIGSFADAMLFLCSRSMVLFERTIEEETQGRFCIWTQTES